MPEVIDGKSYYTVDEWLELPISERHDIEKKMLFKHLANFSNNAVLEFLGRVSSGQINGTQYWAGDEDDCACVLGTLIHMEKRKFGHIVMDEFNDQRNVADTYVPIMDDCPSKTMASPVERMAFNVRIGDLPESNENLGLIRDWTLEYLGSTS